MSTKKPKGPLSDQELETLFEESSKKYKDQISAPDQSDKIIERARRQSSSKDVAEYAFVKFWTTVLEFASLFSIFLKQKGVNKNNVEINDDDDDDKLPGVK